ncbi:hypothetical protein [Pseudomonas sp. PDM20]|uniref:hypothetical protein n=1 Tax=Pseudomonas sp. PDM20 TaxID=2769254 RepID=UPI001784E728|nr:hypothetical protein [Pseudomonas sp. PDM20]MBD9684819.1 hypothetical protein [Pseudomonas sp. PDM20]
MNLTAPSLLHLKDDISNLSLQDAADCRHQALCNMLSFLAGISDHGNPSTDVLAGTFACLEYLAKDSAQLYAAAEARSRAKAQAQAQAQAQARA